MMKKASLVQIAAFLVLFLLLGACIILNGDKIINNQKVLSESTLRYAGNWDLSWRK